MLYNLPGIQFFVSARVNHLNEKEEEALQGILAKMCLEENKYNWIMAYNKNQFGKTLLTVKGLFLRFYILYLENDNRSDLA